MFHHHHETDVPAIALPRVRTVRLLETESELQAAIQRARAFELTRAEQGGRGLSYERYLRDPPQGLADIVHIEPDVASA